jgi:Recombination endonuclease VII
VERSEAEISAKKRAERNKRYAAKFYLADGCALYDALAVAQDYKCGACGRPFSDFTISMNLDHEHVKVLFERISDGNWYAWTDLKDGRRFDAVQRTQKGAVEAVKQRATPASIRGLLCPGRYTGCNRLLGRIDKIEWLKKVLHYLENPPMKKVLDVSSYV